MHGPLVDENIFAVFYVSLCYQVWALYSVIKQHFFKHLFCYLSFICHTATNAQVAAKNTMCFNEL